MEDVAFAIRDRIEGGHPVRHDELRAELGIDVPFAGRDATTNTWVDGDTFSSSGMTS